MPDLAGREVIVPEGVMMDSRPFSLIRERPPGAESVPDARDSPELANS